MELIVPPDTDEEFPSLGGQVVAFLKERACHGPGDLKGQPLQLDDDWEYWLWRAYELWPMGHPKEGRRRFKRGAASVRKGASKCLAPDTSVSMADGSLRRADELRAGDEVLGYNCALWPARVAAVEWQLPSPMVRITTERGRVLTVTGEHPVLTRGTRWRPGMPKRRRYASCDPKRDLDEWVKADELLPGDRVVVGLGCCGTGDLDVEDAWLIGAFCGDGCGQGRFCSADQEIIDRIGRRFPMTKCAGNNGYDHYARGSAGFLREHSMFTTNSRTKRVPSTVLQARPAAVLAFLAGYLDTDGWVTYKPLDNGKTRVQIAWGSVNRDLLADCQHLLAGLGFNVSLRKADGTYNGQPHQAWTLSVSDGDQARRLGLMMLPHMTHPRKREKMDLVLRHVSRCVFGQRDTDKVVSVEQLPDAPSIAVEVADVHTHVTAGIVTHNTELMSLVTFAELHPESPVRFNGFNKDGTLKQGRPVVDPFIPLLANTEKQVEELAYGALKVIVEECPDADLFDASLDRIIRLNEKGKADGKALPVATAPDSNDGGRTTFCGYDETHRLWLPNHKAAIQTMESNLGKRFAQDPWSMSTTTAGEPGKQSQAEDDHFEAEAIARDEVSRPSLFYFHRQAGDGWDMDKFEDRVEAIREASGEQLAARTDLEEIASRWDRPKADKTYLERVWTNRWTQQGAQAFDIKRFTLLKSDRAIPKRAAVTMGFDGARMRDATGFVVTDIRSGLQQAEGLWERPLDAPDAWEVDELEVNEKRKEIFRKYRVIKAYCDPPHWNFTVGAWAAHHPDVVEEFWTNQRRRMFKATMAYEDAIASGSVKYNPDHPLAKDLLRHIGNAGRRDTNLIADEETGLFIWILTKLHPDRKFDLCMAAILSWQARMDVLGTVKTKKRVFARIR